MKFTVNNLERIVQESKKVMPSGDSKVIVVQKDAPTLAVTEAKLGSGGNIVLTSQVVE